MAKNKLSHKYLLHLYSRVDEFLDNEEIAKDELPDAIVSFCITVEKILKIKLHNKNPILIFDSSRVSNDDQVSIIALKKEVDIETIRIEAAIKRFGIIFKKIFTPDEFQALRDIYELRNGFVHGYKPDDKIIFDAENVVSKMGTIWSKISEIAIALFGKDNIKNRKPKKKYTEKELERVLEEEVKKMIEPSSQDRFQNMITVDPGSAYSYLTSPFSVNERCPRCGQISFSRDDNRSDLSSYALTIDEIYHGLSGLSSGKTKLYKCKKCHLELTDKQYEIAKKLE